MTQLRLTLVLALVLPALAFSRSVVAQENPYFVAYDHNLEEPGNLEVEYFSTFGTQRTVKAVDGISLAIRANEIYGIAGESEARALD